MEQPRFLAAVPALAVSDERRAVAFLVDALGFVELTHDGAGLGILRRDQVELHVWVADGSASGAERAAGGHRLVPDRGDRHRLAPRPVPGARRRPPERAAE